MDYQAASKAKVEVVYLCGDCGKDNMFKPKETIRCHDCGYRIMYKKRTNRMVQFEAR
ncbi:RNA polymerase subunit RPABC4/transcription elongation factor Spt4 [Globomyces pollinis-pini]|nr:RNA polymerase subunit RPABC4/transcription elongation factor Spt4 [Globomyces pollinis-pini]